MKIKAAVQEHSDAQPPYVDSRPLVVQKVGLDGPGSGTSPFDHHARRHNRPGAATCPLKSW